MVRLGEILINTPQPYDPAQVAEAQHKAEQVRAAIGRDGTFADIARANSQGPSAAQGGDLGCFTHANLAGTFDDLVFRMQVGDVSDVLRTKQGFVILVVSGRGADSCVFSESLKLLNQPITADLKPYLETLKQKVREQRWYELIPKSAQMKQGSVTIEFSVQRNGAITDQRVASGSGDIDLDEAALKAIRRGSPFSPLPSTTKTDHLVMRFTFQRNPARSDFGLGTGAHGRQMGNLEILSDTQGVDFGPYFQQVVLPHVRQNWYNAVPESVQRKHGNLIIEFAITKAGKVAGMKLVATSGDVPLDRAAWAGIVDSDPFPPLPSEFGGQYIALRFRFFYNPTKEELAPAKPTASAPVVK